MASKKYLLVAGFLSLFSITQSKAQTNVEKTIGEAPNLLDTSSVPSKRLAQQTDFENGQYSFPAKKRNQWEIGINGGSLNVSGDVRSKTIFNGAKDPINTLGWGLTIRKAWGYVFSTRLMFNHGNASGYNYQSGLSYIGHLANPYQKLGITTPVYENYKTTINELSVQLVASLNTVRYHKARSKSNIYAYLGAGGMTYHTKNDIINSKTGLPYDYSSINTLITTNTAAGKSAYEYRKDVNKALRDLWDGEYETEAESTDVRKHVLNGTFRPIGNAGLGVQFRLSKKLTLQFDEKMTITMDDLIDGKRWQEPSSDLTTGKLVTSQMTRDFDNILYTSIGLNLNLGGRSSEPMWWSNPNDYTYNSIKGKTAAPDSKCDKDADGDGISDCFDRCPNTPGGVSVDSHGCPFDTDGDGVADYKDKQLITPTECQPVDADGVGKCPEPACCSGLGHPSVGCSVASGSIEFGSGSAKLSSGAMSQLNNLATSMRSNPNCKAVVVGNGSGSKIEQQRSWDRVNSVINYMVDKQGIDRDRFIFQYGNNGNANSVDYRSAGAGEEGPSNTPPPFPNLRK